MIHWIRDNLALKLLAVGGAAALWTAVSVESSGQTAFQAQLRFRNVPEHLEINPDQIEPVTAVVQGPRSHLQRLQREGVFLDVDCSDVYHAGAKTINVAGLPWNAPAGVRLVKAVPAQLRVLFEESVEREVQIEPRFSGESEPGYAMASYAVEPPTLTVVGPASRVALLSSIETDPIDLTGVVGSRRFETVAYLPDPYVRFAGSPKVTVAVRMRKQD